MPESKSKTIKDVYEIARQLSSSERELLVAMLERDENTSTPSREIKQAWVDESDHRMRLIDEGKAGWVDGEKVLRDLRKSIAR